ncbi:hypothetical protein SCHPADRAFT_940956 [Schizopora paradoxa]|uniref:Actin-like ATPase domain-containing protein n=1 Tax=Schizopora paradoxa TaxID=27342 RepID=A0A0H2RTK4_9AGAM|nr:hypothetical protein SCHPADRAFT_940956 [Schizopora paradoxa]
MSDSPKHTGSHPELVIAIDIGTTYSGVSYTILRPGEVPDIGSVMEFSNQSLHQAKIPTVLCYDSNGKLLGVGPQTSDEALEDTDVDAEWKRLKYIKMHFRPSGTSIDLEMDDLPPDMSAEDVMADLMSYLYTETLKYIEEHHADGGIILGQVRDRIQFVFTHPNGWAGMPQQRYRKCAVLGGLLKNDEEARRRIRFVSEGEASALSCLSSKYAPSPLPFNYKFIVLDAGGGTLDVSGYRVVRSCPLELEEIAVPDSRFAGSIFVNEKAREIIEECVQDSKFDDGETVNNILQEFESKTKLSFDSASRKYSIKIPGVRETIKSLGIVNGCLKLPGERIEECFRFSIENAIESVSSVRDQVSDFSGDMPIWLVGGFGASPWLFKQLKEKLGPKGFPVCKPDSNQRVFVAKVVADGAIHFYIHKSVTTRLSPSSYGVRSSVPYRHYDEDHQRRKHLIKKHKKNGQYIGPTFSCIAKKNEKLSMGGGSSACGYFREVQTPLHADILSGLYAYEGEDPAPIWFDENRDKFRKLCDITADLRELCTPESRVVVDGVGLWELHYSIELTLGSTEIEARVKWEHEGETKYSEAKVVYV